MIVEEITKKNVKKTRKALVGNKNDIIFAVPFTGKRSLTYWQVAYQE
jgi:protein tyrosine phosphatase (PTP) superfamily phosphohydrolase (DUF442 family)